MVDAMHSYVLDASIPPNRSICIQYVWRGCVALYGSVGTYLGTVVSEQDTEVQGGIRDRAHIDVWHREGGGEYRSLSIGGHRHACLPTHLLVPSEQLYVCRIPDFKLVREPPLETLALGVKKALTNNLLSDALGRY